MDVPFSMLLRKPQADLGLAGSPQGRIERAFSVFSARMEVLTVDIACEAFR